jgi:hypothetical protein
VIKITAPIDGFLYRCRPVEGNGLLAYRKVAMEKNFEIVELSLEHLALLSGGGGKDGGGTGGVLTGKNCRAETTGERTGVQVYCEQPVRSSK